MSDANKLLIRCAWKGNSAFSSVYGPTWGPGDCLPDTDTGLTCTGTRTSCNRGGVGRCDPKTHGFYINDQGIPGGPGSNPGEVTKVIVSFDVKSQDAFDDEYQTGENQMIPYKLETIGCTYGNASYYFTPRPVEYNKTTGAPIGAPKCNDNLPKVRDEYVQGRFINDSNIFTPVSDVSNIFKFTWCPDQDQFHVTVFRSGNYVFTHHTGLELLQAEIDQHDTTVAEMQAEIDQLQADNIQLQANKTGTIKVVFV